MRLPKPGLLYNNIYVFFTRHFEAKAPLRAIVDEAEEVVLWEPEGPKTKMAVWHKTSFQGQNRFFQTRCI